MNQQLTPAEQTQANIVQVQWFQGVITTLLAIGAITYFAARVLAVGAEMFKEIKRE